MQAVFEVLLSLLQLNVAFSALYLGLKTARYRDKLYEEIAQEYTEHVPTDNVNSVGAYMELLLNNTFSESHQRVVMWLNQLPESMFQPIEDSLVCRLADTTDLKPPPWYYRWYNCNGDKWAVGLSTGLVPTLILWSLYSLEDKALDVVYDVFFLLILIGQLVIVAHIVGGSRMVKQCSKDFSTALDNIVPVFEKALAEKEQDAVKQKINPSSTSV